MQKMRLIKRVSINFFQKIDNLIIKNLLNIIAYIKSNTKQKNKKDIYYKNKVIINLQVF